MRKIKEKRIDKVNFYKRLLLSGFKKHRESERRYNCY